MSGRWNISGLIVRSSSDKDVYVPACPAVLTALYTHVEQENVDLVRFLATDSEYRGHAFEMFILNALQHGK
eukprot:m.188503 g.188503  ORF g.188503 m.188503 type:complete len:71 (+) comp16725_c0_seq4:1412-1624(+)